MKKQTVTEGTVAMDVDESSPVADAKPETTDPTAQIRADIKQNLFLLERGASCKEARYISRVLRTIPSTRKLLDGTILAQIIAQTIGNNSDLVRSLSVFTGEADSAALGDKKRKGSTAEVDTYLQILVIIWLLDSKRIDEAVACSTDLIERVSAYNRRSLDPLSARAFYYYGRAYELAGRFSEIRKVLFNALRTSTLRHDTDGQATLINLLLRSYLHYNLYEQAHKLVSKSSFPENASNNELARYMYYLGRISAIQLMYVEAHKFLESAVRKAPQNSAAGFQQTAQKFCIIVQLLLGDIPERSVFRQPMLRQSLTAYKTLTLAVHRGDLVLFNETVESNIDKFQADKTYTLILRLRHNVIKTGVRRICQSYSAISLLDICSKLHLESTEDAEYIVAKAIRDGAVAATIDHESGVVRSKEPVDTYSTNEPQTAFYQRTQLCLNMYNDTVKAMRFPPNDYRKELESAEERRLRDQQEKEIIDYVEGEDDDTEF
eukprot:CFRG1123T1